MPDRPARKVFVDTNVFFYAYDERLPEQLKRSQAWLDHLSLRRLGVASLQVANEFTNVVLLRMPHLPNELVFRLADNVLAWGDTGIDLGTIAKAREVRTSYRYSWWDSLLLASALELGCTHFLSEDLQDGQTIEVETGKGLTIVDPFAHTPEQILVSL